MSVAEDLEVDQVLAEPIVAQPVFLNFDHRGRMWVVQYIQYPHPAGLSIVSHDQYWRNVYDKVPPPPPNHFRGKDKITIHEDTDGDGVFDKHKTFLEGMNMVTSLEHGRGGLWVLNPPYLLFYPDADGNDVPDADPEVRLAGFGLEDSHSIANSLRWGPDGWLYGAQGSTVTANIVQPGYDEKPIYSQGQNVWRYHPERRIYEVFAEGGGNAFGVEIDSQGRVFSGHNGGNTRGFHYPQGGYLRKGFTKHGPLSNPYAFGYFEGMPHHDVERFTHNFLIYDGASLPANYHGKLFGVEPLQGRIVVSRISPLGSSFETTDLDRPLTSTDSWFRPVDIKLGPDGNIYICDWYDGQVNHYRNHQGQIDPTNGRIYRLRGKRKSAEATNLSGLSSAELVDHLAHSNRWVRQTALRMLGDRRDAHVVPRLEATLAKEEGQLALESLWALNLSGGFTPERAMLGLRHANPYVRYWTVRLLGDEREVTPAMENALVALAASEEHVEVRQQLACSARRLPTAQGLTIVRELLRREADAADVYQPLLLWWAVETFCRDSPNDVIAQLETIWNAPIVTQTILPRLIQRFAMESTRSDLDRCAQLLEAAPSVETQQILMKGFEEAFRGRPLTNLPTRLVNAIADAGGGSLDLRVRQGDITAVEQALATIDAPEVEADQRMGLIMLVGELKVDGAADVLLRRVESRDDPAEVQHAALGALRNFDSPEVARRVLNQYPKLDEETQKSAQRLLASRVESAQQMLSAAAEGAIDPLSIALDVLRDCLLFRNADIQSSISETWGDISGNTSEEMKAEIVRLSRLLNARTGDVYQGQKLFRAECGKCHKLFIDGGDVGPDLTTYKRDDVANMVLNVINPNAEIREGFENYLILTVDGRVITGLMVERDNQVVVLRTADGQTDTIARDEIEESRVLGRSLMPEGLLKSLTDEQIVDLFAYLRSTQPLNN